MPELRLQCRVGSLAALLSMCWPVPDLMAPLKQQESS